MKIPWVEHQYRQLVSIPLRDASVSFERYVRLNRCGIDRLVRFRRLLEASADVAALEDLGGRRIDAARKDQRRIGFERFLHFHHERHRIVVDTDNRDSVVGDLRGYRSDSRHFLSGEAHDLIVAFKRGANAGQPARTCEIDVAHTSMRVGAAQDRAIDHPGHFDIVRVARAARGLERAIESRHFRADHGHLVAPLPRGGIVVRDHQRHVVDMALEAELNRHPAAHPILPPDDFTPRRFSAAASAALKTCG